MKEELLTYCKEQNVLLDGFLLEIFVKTNNLENIKIIIDKLKNNFQKRFISLDLINQNKLFTKKLLSELFYENKEILNILLENLNLKEFIEEKKEIKQEVNVESKVKISSSYMKQGKSLEVKDFVEHFKSRYIELSNILQERPELENLTSISKISDDKQKISVIGMIVEKKQTKNKNVIIEIEDLTGRMKVLISSQKEDLLKEADDIALDSVIAFKGLGNKDILFANEIIFPETRLFERKKSPIEEYALFTGDLHYGSKKFMEKSFLKFIEYLNGKIPDTPEVEKIKYLFIVGDLITGVGNYPNQEEDLVIQDLEEQFQKMADLLSKIRQDIKIIICPGNHDGVRLMEPQPILDEKYSWPLYELPNVIITENPSYVTIGERPNFSGITVLCYHGFSFPYYANNVPKLMIEKTMNSPEKIMKYLLKNRHLAPTHASNQYFPSDKDALLIRKVPDIFVSGHTHKSGVIYENNVMIVSSSTWEGMTPYQEKFGNKPDHCKVPMVNLKTRAVKILDFEVEEEGIKVYKEDEE